MRNETLLDAINAIRQPSVYSKAAATPLRLPIQAVYKIGGIGTVPVGRVESGRMTPGQIVTFAPDYHTTEVLSIEMHHNQVKEAARVGFNVGFNVKYTGNKEIKRGDVCGDAKNDPPKRVGSFVATTIIINRPLQKKGQIKAGYTPIISIHTTNIGRVCFDFYDILPMFKLVARW